MLQTARTSMAIPGLKTPASNETSCSFLILEPSWSRGLRLHGSSTDSPRGDTRRGLSGRFGRPGFPATQRVFTSPFFSADPDGDRAGSSSLYTLDGTVPTATHGTLYTGAISVTTSVPVRARVFETGLAPGPVMTRQYARLAPSVTGFTSNLPIVVVDTFGYGLVQDFLTPALISLIDTPSPTGRGSILDAPSFVGSAGIRMRGSSFAELSPRSSFALETWDSSARIGRSPSSLPTESDWIPLRALLRRLRQNVLAYRWSNAIGRTPCARAGRRCTSRRPRATSPPSYYWGQLTSS